MNRKSMRTSEDLQALLSEEILYLHHSAELFDSGYQCEAKRLATTLRVLLHDGKGVSLFKQMGLQGARFVDTSWRFEEENKLTYLGLVSVGMYKDEIDYIPPLDDCPNKREKSFQNWWKDDPIFFLPGKREKLTRSKVILNLANKDGGAHVDPKIDAAYHELNDICKSAYVPYGKFEKIFETPYDFAAARQIAHEIMLILKKEFPDLPKYQINPRRMDYQLLFGGPVLKQH